MDKVISNLQQWIVRFLKNKDLIFRRIEEIKEDSGSIRIKYKNKEQEILIVPDMEAIDFDRIRKGSKGIVTMSNMKNVDFVVNQWEKFIENRELVIYFVNPFSKTEKKWVIFPHTHNKVIEGTKIKEGLISLFSGVEPITIEEYKRIVE